MPKPWDSQKSRGLRSGTLIVERPNCVALMGAVVLEWSAAESALGGYYSEIVCGPTVEGIPGPHGGWAAMETFDMVTNPDQRAKMLIVAANRLNFRQSVVDEFEDKLARLNKAYKKRIIVAHGRWMIDEDIPDALVWQRRLGGFASEAMVYFEADFQQWLNDIAGAAYAVDVFFNESMRPRLQEYVRSHARFTRAAMENLDNAP